MQCTFARINAIICNQCKTSNWNKWTSDDKRIDRRSIPDLTMTTTTTRESYVVYELEPEPFPGAHGRDRVGVSSATFDEHDKKFATFICKSYPKQLQTFVSIRQSFGPKVSSLSSHQSY